MAADILIAPVDTFNGGLDFTAPRLDFTALRLEEDPELLLNLGAAAAEDEGGTEMETNLILDEDMSFFLPSAPLSPNVPPRPLLVIPPSFLWLVLFRTSSSFLMLLTLLSSFDATEDSELDKSEGADEVCGIPTGKCPGFCCTTAAAGATAAVVDTLVADVDKRSGEDASVFNREAAENAMQYKYLKI